MLTQCLRSDLIRVALGANDTALPYSVGVVALIPIKGFAIIFREPSPSRPKCRQDQSKDESRKKSCDGSEPTLGGTEQQADEKK